MISRTKSILLHVFLLSLGKLLLEVNKKTCIYAYRQSMVPDRYRLFNEIVNLFSFLYFFFSDLPDNMHKLLYESFCG